MPGAFEMQPSQIDFVDGSSTEVLVDEFQPYEPSAYAYEEGYVVVEKDGDRMWFVAASGVYAELEGEQPLVEGASCPLQARWEEVL